MTKREHEVAANVRGGWKPPRRMFLLGAALTVPWFVSYYVFDVQDVIAALLAFAGYILIFTAAGKVVLAWFRQRKSDRPG